MISGGSQRDTGTSGWTPSAPRTKNAPEGPSWSPAPAPGAPDPLRLGPGAGRYQQPSPSLGESTPGTWKARDHPPPHSHPGCSSSRSPRPPSQQERLPGVRDLPAGAQAAAGMSPHPHSAPPAGVLAPPPGDPMLSQVAGRPQSLQSPGKAACLGKRHPPQSAATHPTPQGTVRDRGDRVPAGQGGRVDMGEPRPGRAGGAAPRDARLPTSLCSCHLMPVGRGDLDCRRGATGRVGDTQLPLSSALPSPAPGRHFHWAGEGPGLLDS